MHALLILEPLLTLEQLLLLGAHAVITHQVTISSLQAHAGSVLMLEASMPTLTLEATSHYIPLLPYTITIAKLMQYLLMKPTQSNSRLHLHN